MIEERIGEVRVRVRTNIPDAAEVRPAAERMVRAVIERCAALLEARAPGRVVLIRRLPLHWRVDESAFDDAEHVEDLALAAADAIERISRPPVLDPPAAAEGAVIFDDEPHLRASHLLALARGGPAWFHTALDVPSNSDPLVALAAPARRETAHATLLRLAREGVLAEVLAARPAVAVAVFAAALGCDVSGLSGGEAEAQASTGGAPPGSGPASTATGFRAARQQSGSLAAQLAAIASAWPPLAPAARLLALRVHAAVLAGTSLESPAASSLAAAVFQGDARAFDREPPPISESEQSVPVEGAPENGPAKEIAKEEAATTDRPPEPAEVRNQAGPASSEFVSTGCGGLFYLFDRIQELDLAESLWKACLPEDMVLAAAASALLGPRFSGDPAPALFGGVQTKIVCPPVTSGQQTEIAAASCASLAAALPRRGLAGIPPAVVTLADHPAGRLLVAAAENSPFAFFAWPADTPKTLAAGLRALLDAWPHHGVLAASPALAGIDKSGRLRPATDIARSPWLLPEAPSAAAAALLAIVVGAPCTLFAARAAGTFDAAAAFVARFLARQARIRMGAGEMTVILRDDDIDLAVRRAGLDRDPGWLPWLRRTVRFVYQEQKPPEGETA
ncbi:MAG: hypothetical protein P4L56_03850 [Candidatus Sulfopaludibacter sp.]|nr:hypothetical protein [Candidatus Sulfopaludibacter sp.]